VVRSRRPPEIVMRAARTADTVRIPCDLAPTGRSWDVAAWRSIGRMLYHLQPVERAGCHFTSDELQPDGLEMREAIAIVRGLVDLATAGRFRPQAVPPPEPPVRSPRFPHQTRMERNDQ
jgi:hypothetical protein